MKKILVSILIPFYDFGTNLDRFWEGFGGQVGTMLGPNATDTRAQNQSKKLGLFGRPPDRIWVDLGSQVGPRKGIPIFEFLNIFGSWGRLGARMGPGRPKKPEEAPKTASKTDFGAILIDFWLIFWSIFWLVWGFISALAVCCGGLLLCWIVGLLLCWLVALLVF